MNPLEQLEEEKNDKVSPKNKSKAKNIDKIMKEKPRKRSRSRDRKRRSRSKSRDRSRKKRSRSRDKSRRSRSRERRSRSRDRRSKSRDRSRKKRSRSPKRKKSPKSKESRVISKWDDYDEASEGSKSPIVLEKDDDVLIGTQTVKDTDIFCRPGRFARPVRLAIILRGLPGAGKSMVAKNIEKTEKKYGKKTKVMAWDEYFKEVCSF